MAASITVFYNPHANRSMPVPFGPDYTTVREYADLIAKRRFNVTARELSPEQADIIIDAVYEMLRDLDELREPGRAS